MMASPKTLHISKFTVDAVLEAGSAVAHVEDLSSDISFGGEVPVSYTHLIRCLVLHRHRCFELSLWLHPNIPNTTGTLSVSYTHLDVYKRQDDDKTTSKLDYLFKHIIYL